MSKEDFSKIYDKTRELCFDKNEFLKESFSVDSFLREHRNKASLEVMRDDLGFHLKSLRLSMIELINKDYEDFVNLSKDLIGLDDKIQKLQTPLEQIKSEVLAVKNDFEEAISGFDNCFAQHKELIHKKKSLIHVSQVMRSIKKLNNIFNINNLNQNDFTLNLIERATMEYNQLQFSVSKCSNDLLTNQKQEAENIKNQLMTILSNKFLECLKKKNTDELLKCLRIYASLDKTSELESLVRQEVIAPRLSTIITEQKLQKEPEGIDEIFNEIILYIEKDLGELIKLTMSKNNSPVVKGYNFMLKSFWPELEKRLNLPFMFALGDPKLFHYRYTKSINLLKKLELYCGNESDVLLFKKNEKYQYFLQKFNLPVYFKIRFQEIAGQLEKHLEDVNNEFFTMKTKSEDIYNLKISNSIFDQIKKCWESDVYLPEISHLFWKFSLQIISRYSIWLWDIMCKESENINNRKLELTNVQNVVNTESFQIQSRLDFLVCLYSDTSKLVNEIEIFLESCKGKIPNRHLVEEELTVSLKESLTLVEGAVPKITDSIVKVIVTESAVHFRQVSQIPRLFRRTNRKSSTEPCEYVGQVLSYPKKFYERKKNLISEETIDMWLSLIFNDLTQQYFTAVSEVLTNAQKTEESLRKLKRKKENFPNKNSGDDEIRQQLVIDVHSYSDGLKDFNVLVNKVKMLSELVSLVESARDKSEKQ